MVMDQRSLEIYKLLGLMTIKLNYDNFISWSYQLQILLEGQGLFGYVDGSVACDTTNTEGVTCESNVAFETWKKTDQLVLSFLLATLDSDIMDYVVGSKSCREAWGCLREMFCSSSRINVMQLKTDIRTITKGSDSIERYLLRIRKARNKLRAVGVTISDEDIVVLTLSGLPDEYDVLKMVILCRETLISENDRRLQLLAAERKIESSICYSSSMSGGMHVQYHSQKSQWDKSWSYCRDYITDQGKSCFGNLKGNSKSKTSACYNDWNDTRSSSNTKVPAVGLYRGIQECDSCKEDSERYTEVNKYTTEASCNINQNTNVEFCVLGLTGVEPVEPVTSSRLLISGGNGSDGYDEKDGNIVNLGFGAQTEGNGDKGSGLECSSGKGDNRVFASVSGGNSKDTDLDKGAKMGSFGEICHKNAETEFSSGGNVNSGVHGVDFSTGENVGGVGSKKENRDVAFVEENIGGVCFVRILLMIALMLTITMILTLMIIVGHYSVVLSMTCLMVMQLIKQAGLFTYKLGVCFGKTDKLDSLLEHKKNVLGAIGRESSKLAGLFAGTIFQLNIFKVRLSKIVTLVPLMRKLLIIHNRLKTSIKFWMRKLCILVIDMCVRITLSQSQASIPS